LGALIEKPSSSKALAAHTTKNFTSKTEQIITLPEINYSKLLYHNLRGSETSSQPDRYEESRTVSKKAELFRSKPNLFEGSRTFPKKNAELFAEVNRTFSKKTEPFGGKPNLPEKSRTVPKKTEPFGGKPNRSGISRTFPEKSRNIPNNAKRFSVETRSLAHR